MLEKNEQWGFCCEADAIEARIQIAVVGAIGLKFDTSPVDPRAARLMWPDRELLLWEQAGAAAVFETARTFCYIDGDNFASAIRTGLSEGSIAEFVRDGGLVYAPTFPHALGAEKLKAARRNVRAALPNLATMKRFFEPPNSESPINPQP